MFLFPVLLKIMVGNGLCPIVMKKQAKSAIGTKLVWQFGFCALLTLLLSLLRGELEYSKITLLLVAMGIVNSIATGLQWKAINISLSRSSIFAFMDDIVAMALSVILLGEYKLLGSPYLLVGILISLFSLISLAAKEKEQKGNKARVYPYVISYCLIWGVLTFVMKVSSGSISALDFLAPWYVGSFLGAFLQTKSGILPSSKTINLWPVALLSLGIVSSLALTYWSYKVAPMVVAQPLFLIGEALVPTVIGLTFFREKIKGQAILMLVALAGGVLIALGAAKL